MGKPRKPRSDAKMYQLPKAILQGVDERLVNYNMSYADIRAWLAEKGYKVSQASLSRYAFKVFEAAQRIADDLEKTKAVVDFIGRNPDLDTTEATSAILKSGLLQKISSAEEEFNDMPIEKAGRLFVQLSKAEADRKRTAAAVKKKAELALDAMNDDILDAIKHHPDLVADWHEVFERAKKRILDEEG
ncbi:MAG: DUF3486 family protein, partial [Lachnospiraceae bacterium]|nr:DUF3486 family protein [Lachnospiraceae bacterium]